MKFYVGPSLFLSFIFFLFSVGTFRRHAKNQTIYLNSVISIGLSSITNQKLVRRHYPVVFFFTLKTKTNKKHIYIHIQCVWLLFCFLSKTEQIKPTHQLCRLVVFFFFFFQINLKWGTFSVIQEKELFFYYYYFVSYILTYI